ncbi:hypothetical protein GC169_03410 [bacterium]|nr:hypothetical protein [bacterium]
MNERVVRIAGLLLVLSAASGLGACGLRGDLERPMPIWGDPPLDGPTDPRVIKAEEQRRAEAAAAAEAEKAPADTGAETGASTPAPAPPNR